MNSLSNYTPSETWLNASHKYFDDESLLNIEPKIEPYLSSLTLNYDNFCAVLKTLLTIDDLSTMQMYADLTLFKVKVAMNKKKHFSINFIKSTKNKRNTKSLLTPHIDQIVLVSRAGLDTLPLPKPLILANFISHGIVETILRVTNNRIIFNFRENLLNQPFDVFFRAPRIPVRLMLHALQALEKSPDIRRYLFPISDLKKQQTAVPNTPNTLTLLNKSIAANAEQLQAVRQIVNGPNPLAPYIVFGPPGTGKTTTIVEAIVQLYMKGNNRILVTAGSNSACDTIALKIIEYIENYKRLQEMSKEKELIMLRLLPYTRFKRVKKTMSPKLLNYCNFKNINNSKVYVGLRKINLSNYGIIVTTLCAVGIVNLVNKPKFTHIFIDEAAASTEPETLLGIVGIKQSSSHVILCGDHKQLGAVIKCERAADLGLLQSLMERLLLSKLYEVDASGNYDQTLQTRLRRNYRSHPEIVGIYNKLYYNSELIPVAPPAMVNQAANWSVLPNGKYPILFQAAEGDLERAMHSSSSFNQHEADVVCWYLMRLLTEKIGHSNVEQKDIGIMSPYLAQCKLIKKMLQKRGQTKVKVGSVESYQGSEKMIIIASMVSSFKSTYFLSNSRRVNVLLSRAKSLLIIIGNPVTLREHEDFKYIIDQCRLNDNLLYGNKNMTDELREQANGKYEDRDYDSDSSSSSRSSTLAN